MDRSRATLKDSYVQAFHTVLCYLSTLMQTVLILQRMSLYRQSAQQMLIVFELLILEAEALIRLQSERFLSLPIPS